MKKKSIVLVATALMLMAAMVVGGTLAYFTDKDDEVNTFTVGSVDIELIESQYHRVNAGKGYTTEAEPLQGGYLWASNVQLEGTVENTPDAANTSWTGEYFSDAQIKADAETYKEGYFAEKSVNMVPGNNVRKNPYVINTGKNDAYVRVRVQVPYTLFEVLDKGPSFWTTTALASGEVTSADVEYYNANGTSENVLLDENYGMFYTFEFVYEKPLAPGAMTFWNVWGNIAIDPAATAEDLAGVESFDVLFQADAIQADGFATAAEAFAAFDAQK